MHLTYGPQQLTGESLIAFNAHGDFLQLILPMMGARSKPNFPRGVPELQHLTVILMYTSPIQKVLHREVHSQRNDGNVNPDLTDKDQLPEQSSADL